jgi:hypothetical protein
MATKSTKPTTTTTAVATVLPAISKKSETAAGKAIQAAESAGRTSAKGLETLSTAVLDFLATRPAVDFAGKTLSEVYKGIALCPAIVPGFLLWMRKLGFRLDATTGAMLRTPKSIDTKYLISKKDVGGIQKSLEAERRKVLKRKAEKAEEKTKPVDISAKHVLVNLFLDDIRRVQKISFKDSGEKNAALIALNNAIKALN